MENKILTLSFGRLRNDEHLSFHLDNLEFIKQCGADKLLSADLLPLYEEVVAIQESVYKRQTTSDITPVLEESDVKRDRYITHCFALLAAAKTSPEDEEVKAYNRLVGVMGHYKGIANSPQKQESLEIKSMIKDLSNPKLTESVELLRMTKTLSLLEVENNNFMELERQRTSETAARAETQKHRANTEHIYQQICDHAYAAYLVSKLDDVKKYLSDLNNLILKTQNYYKLRKGHTSTIEGEDVDVSLED